MFVILREIEIGLSGNPIRNDYQYLTKESQWSYDRNKAREFPKKNSALVHLTKMGLANKDNIIIIED